MRRELRPALMNVAELARVRAVASRHAPEFWRVPLRSMLFTLAALVAVLLMHADLNIAAESPTAGKYDPVDYYRTETIQGWQIKIHRDLFDEPQQELRKKSLQLLDDHLYRIARVIPQATLDELRRVPIWIEVKHPRHPCMCYHTSADWLREHDMNPAKAKGVEIANCENFLTWTHDQPWMVLHELAHAFHDRVLSFEHAAIKGAHARAVEAGLYDKVLRINGREDRHYAATNPMEYFAEATEAYFGTNDFYPFVRAELKRHDPAIYDLIEQVWRVKR